MRACPLRFDHPSEAQQLHGLGAKLCDRLAEKLRVHCIENGLPLPTLPRRSPKRQAAAAAAAATSNSDEGQAPAPPQKKPRKVKKYVPALRSGAYALILALASIDENAVQGLTKADTIELAQPHCDSSFTAPSDPTKFFTAWNSMKTLIGKDLVYEHGRPLRRYMLTEEGWEVAKRIHGAGNGSIRSFLTRDGSNAENLKSTKETTIRDEDSSARAQSRDSAFIDLDDVSLEGIGGDIHPDKTFNSETPPADTLPDFVPIVFPPGSFSVHLVLDSREIRTVKDRDYISEQLQRKGVNPITRTLPLGDALWVARPKPGYEDLLTKGNVDDDEEGCDEIVLDHIVERKRLDDLISSIKDGRFHEQKFRLGRSGISNVTYIIEDFSISTEKGEKYGEAVSSAIASTQILNGYFVKQTAKLDATIAYLATMTSKLQKMYAKESLHIIPSKVLHPHTYLSLLSKLLVEQGVTGHYITFSAFSSLCSKSDTMSLRDVFLKMLMCIRGVTGEKALEVQKRWKTPIDLFEALEELSGTARKRMVAEQLDAFVQRKRVTNPLSEKIAEIWS
jgi:crossover junction endonuclease MUS81